MKSFLVCVLVLVTGVGSASACSYHIDQEKKSAELKQVALANLGDVKVVDSEVKGFSFFESKPTPMCPEEMTYEATVSVNYLRYDSTCSVELAVKKIESWGELDQDSYIVTGARKALCYQ